MESVSAEEFIDNCYNNIMDKQTQEAKHTLTSSASNALDGLWDQSFNDSTALAVSNKGIPQSTPTITKTMTQIQQHGILKDSLGESLRKRKKMSPVGNHPFNKEFNLSDEQYDIADAIHNSLLSVITDQIQDIELRADKSIEEKLDEYKLTIAYALHDHAEQLESLQEENKSIKTQYRILEGRLTRSEKLVEDLSEQLLQTDARSMRDNLVFFNIPEQSSENPEHILRDFFADEMQICDADQQGINFDRVHRMGQYSRGKNRPMVAKFNPYIGKEIVLKHAKNLDKSKKFGVNEQLPRELEERKKQLLPQFKDAQKDQKKPKWSMDKLVIDGKVLQVKKDTVMDININTTEIASQIKVYHAPPKTFNNSSFQGHHTKISTQDDVTPSLHAVFADSRVARATHNIYAYRLKRGTSFTEHYEDDGEWGAGRLLLKLLRDNHIEDRLVCVTRWYGGSHLGRARFDHILEAARQTLNIEATDQHPTSESTYL